MAGCNPMPVTLSGAVSNGPVGRSRHTASVPRQRTSKCSYIVLNVNVKRYCAQRWFRRFLE